MKKLSRRQFIGAATAAGTATAFGNGPASVVLSAQAPQPPAAGGGTQPDVTLVLTNGRIHTMDASNTVARTVVDQQRPVRHRRRCRPGPWTQHARHRPQGPHGRARPHRGPRPHRQPGQPSRLSHDSREHDVDPGDSGGAGRAAQGRAGGAVDHVDGRLAPEPVGRASASDAEGARRGRARSPGAALRAVHRSVRHQQPRQGVLRRRRRAPRRCTRTSCR